jgi:hypothetical protein
LLWFHLEEEEDAVLSALSAGRLDEAAGAWESVCSAGAGSRKARRPRRQQQYERKRARALRNLAVVAHFRALEAERTLARPASLGAPDLWRHALALWSEVAGTAECWEPFKRQLGTATDPRLGAEFLAELRRDLGARVLSIHAEIAESAVNQELPAYASQHLRLIEGSDFPADQKESVLSSFFAAKVAQARQLLMPLILQSESLTSEFNIDAMSRQYRDIRVGLSALGAEKRLAGLAEEAVASACARLRNEVNGAHSLFAKADLECFRGYSGLIAEWNHYMDEYNRLPAFLDRAAMAHLRRVHGELRARRSDMIPVEKRLGELTEKVVRARAVASFLEYLAQDAGDAERQQIRKELQNANEALDHAGREFGKTKDHYERNLTGMTRNLNA